MLVTTRSTSRFFTLSASVAYRLDPPLSMNAKWNAAVHAIAWTRSWAGVVVGDGTSMFGGVLVSLIGIAV